jgi:hypothetical protein
MVFDNQDSYENLDDLRHDLTIASGFFTRRINIEGDEIKKPKSISFSSMDEFEFENLYNAFLSAITKHFNFDEELIKENIEQFY